jgi:hypothetical protein
VNVLSIDLAYRTYHHFGISLFQTGERRAHFPGPGDLGLHGAPRPDILAGCLDGYCRQHTVTVLLLDGPQGWRDPGSPIPHMRVCERVLNTPCKTGDPGEVKPRPYLLFVEFSIGLVQHLRMRFGWRLLEADWMRRPGQRWLVESFPSAAWEPLGLRRPPSKARAQPADLLHARRTLMEAIGFELPNAITHDELQAAAVLPAGLAIAERRPEDILLVGMDPFVDDHGRVLEGWIVLPRRSPTS